MTDRKTDWSRVIAVTNRGLCGGDFYEQIRKVCVLGVKAVILREKDLSPEDYAGMAERVLRICEEEGTVCILHTFWREAEKLGCGNLHLPLPVLEEMRQEERRLSGTRQEEVQLSVSENPIKEKEISISGAENPADAEKRMFFSEAEAGNRTGSLQNCWKILGCSAHSLEQAARAQELGATYLTAGHIFATGCKPGVPPRGLDFLREICENAAVPVYAIGGIDEDNMQQALDAGAAGVCMMSQMMRL